VATLAFFRGIIGRLAIFLAVVGGYALALILGDVDTSAIAAAPWVGLPHFQTPARRASRSRPELGGREVRTSAVAGIERDLRWSGTL
jgi:hypothetical protein